MNDYKCGFITVAFGKHYWKIAYNLLLSYRLGGGKLPFAIITDCADARCRDFDDVIVATPREKGTLNKLLIFELSPYEEFIFIDADCLAYGNLDVCFDDFRANASDFSSYGRNYSCEECPVGYFDYRKAKVLAPTIMPNFNGGMYYVLKNDSTRKMFDTAFQLAHCCEDYGFRPVCDETVFALAMSMHRFRLCEKIRFGLYTRSRIIYMNIIRHRLKLKIEGVDAPTEVLMMHWGTNLTHSPLYHFEVANMINNSSRSSLSLPTQIRLKQRLWRWPKTIKWYYNTYLDRFITWAYTTKANIQQKTK